MCCLGKTGVPSKHSVLLVIVSYSTVAGIYGRKQTESEGIDWTESEVCLLAIAINPWPPMLYIPPDWSFVVITVNTTVPVQVFTVTSIFVYTQLYIL